MKIIYKYISEYLKTSGMCFATSSGTVESKVSGGRSAMAGAARRPGALTDSSSRGSRNLDALRGKIAWAAASTFCCVAARERAQRQREAVRGTHGADVCADAGDGQDSLERQVEGRPAEDP